MFLRKIPVIVSCLALIGLAVFFLWPAPVRTQVRINDKVFDVEVVSTDKTTAQGLSGREKLETIINLGRISGSISAIDLIMKSYPLEGLQLPTDNTKFSSGISKGWNIFVSIPR